MMIIIVIINTINPEYEAIVYIQLTRADQIFQGGGMIVSMGEIQVHRGPRAILETEIERVATLDYPAIGRDG